MAKAKEVFKSNFALVTGGSSGIGFELARLLLKEGARVGLVGTDPAKLKKARTDLESESREEILLIQKDLSEHYAPREIFEELASKHLEVDILVNNAGFGVKRKFHEMDLEQSLKMSHLHIDALLSLTYLFLPGMMKRGFGKILNVSSLSAFQAVPMQAVYASSKSFVLYFSEALAEELKGTGVDVTCLCPGVTKTEFFRRNDFSVSKIMSQNMMESRAVAEAAVQGLKKKQTLVIPGFKNRVIPLLERTIPRKWATFLAGKMVE